MLLTVAKIYLRQQNSVTVTKIRKHVMCDHAHGAHQMARQAGKATAGLATHLAYLWAQSSSWLGRTFAFTATCANNNKSDDDWRYACVAAARRLLKINNQKERLSRAALLNSHGISGGTMESLDLCLLCWPVNITGLLECWPAFRLLYYKTMALTAKKYGHFSECQMAIKTKQPHTQKTKSVRSCWQVCGIHLCIQSCIQLFMRFAYLSAALRFCLCDNLEMHDFFVVAAPRRAVINWK